jgi:phosphomannomutase
VFSTVKLFGTAGIRLRYPVELDPVLAYRIGVAVGALKLSRRAYIVTDTRTTRYVLSLSLASGLLSSGVDVCFVGVAPTPVAGYAARAHSAVGISVTASHNPPEYNGFKFYDPEGYEFTRSLEEAVEKFIETPPTISEWRSVGVSEFSSEVLKNYIEDLLEFLGESRALWRPRVVVDCANGASYDVTPAITRRLGAIPVTVNCNPDGFFPVRPPEPRRDVLESLLPVYRAADPVLIVAHDGDADRVAFLDPVAGFIRQDRILAFFAKKILEERRGRVVVSIDTGFVVDDVVEELGGTLERYALGKTHERVRELGASNVVMAGEPWKLIYTKWGPWVDGILQVGIVVKNVVERGKPLVKILEEENIPDYPWDRRSYLLEPLEIRDRVYADLVEEVNYALGEPVGVLTLDGYRFEYPDRSWVLVRKSGTEPKIRLYAEAQDGNRLEFIVKTVENIVFKTTKKHGGRVLEVTIG